MLARVAAGADVAIGSRYVPGGSVDETWGFRRRQLSLWGSRLARWIAGLQGVRDCTAGFKAIRTSALRAARVEDISVLGYAFQVALLHRLLHRGARVVEEPIYFRDRERGVTKLGLDCMLEFFYHILWLRLTSHRTFIKFALTGLSGVSVNLGSFHLLLQNRGSLRSPSQAPRPRRPLPVRPAGKIAHLGASVMKRHADGSAT